VEVAVVLIGPLLAVVSIVATDGPMTLVRVRVSVFVVVTVDVLDDEDDEVVMGETWCEERNLSA
jgi:hypothetical protein